MDQQETLEAENKEEIEEKAEAPEITERQEQEHVETHTKIEQYELDCFLLLKYLDIMKKIS